MAMQALQATGNNIDQAANYLMEGGNNSQANSGAASQTTPPLAI